MTKTIVEIQDAILRKNDDLASALRSRFSEERTYVINLLSSPGSGKTTLLEETLRRAQPLLRVAALVGDQATENDAARLARSGAPVRQISTGAECRLDAHMIESALRGWEPARCDLLCIENVGNLICPAEYNLGEDLRVVLFSVTEGEDKPLKYPLAFNTSQVALITKIDLAEAVDFDRDAAHRNIQQVHPGIPIIEVSARNGHGVDTWMNFLRERIAQRTNAALV
ncbi:MAG: hydrogenase nickel incorporation protein HypB [Candidatus Eremiobacteraeota bacterium]|nr:hydrogenase nickel incorporation protein HypB [Candidatus Eremiobacteraeota bacterium]